MNVSSLFPWLQRAQRLSAEDFAGLLPQPVLVLLPYADQDELGVDTLSATTSRARMGSEEVVIPLEKRGGNPFANMITIGRARNNDVVLKASEVSKFHAYVRVRPGVAELVDSGSTFGTFLSGRKLEAHAATVLESGVGVAFGGCVRGAFFWPSGFFEALRTGRVFG